MKTKKLCLGVPYYPILIVFLIGIIGIIVGSFYDFQISTSFVNVNQFDRLIEGFGLVFVYTLIPFSGVMVFISLKDRGTFLKVLGWIILIFAYVSAVYFLGDPLKWSFGYKGDGNDSFTIYLPGYAISLVLMGLLIPLAFKVLSKDNKEYLLRLGILILLVLFIQYGLSMLLKNLASRPRYRFLISDTNTTNIEFRNWWEFKPFSSNGNDGLRSFPSGHMSWCSMLFMLPLFHSALKKQIKNGNIYLFLWASFYTVLVGITRIHSGGHFLSDVSWGLITGLSVVVILNLIIKPGKFSLTKPLTSSNQ